MKSLTSLLCFSSVMALASAAAVQSPSGSIYVFTLPECLSVQGLPIVNPTTVALPLGKCVSISQPFTSFEGLVVNYCTKGSATITVYGNSACTGTGLSAGGLPHSKLPTACIEATLNAKSIGLGQSAKFTCE